eukprot:439429-Prymnesium_polylepis.1
MLPALARRSSTSAGMQPDAEVPCRLPRTKQTMPARRSPGSNHCRHRSPTQKTTKRIRRSDRQVDARDDLDAGEVEVDSDEE